MQIVKVVSENCLIIVYKIKMSTIDQVTQTEHELKVGDFVMKDCKNCGIKTRMRYDGRCTSKGGNEDPRELEIIERFEKRSGYYTCQGECGGTCPIEDGLGEK